jgi:hypothetical protein
MCEEVLRRRNDWRDFAARDGAVIPKTLEQGSMDERTDRKLTPEAERALEEAAARRVAAEKLAAEHGGPSGPEPTRYGDWERSGIAVDF